jgi:ATP-dependent DNA helicase RecG
VLACTNNGFELAEKDMEFRGVGDVFGTRQHGKGVLKIASLVQDMRQLEKARHVLEILAENDRFAREYGSVTRAAKEVMDSKMLEIALN